MLIVTLAAALLLVALPLRLGPSGLARSVLFAILVLALVNFATLTVEVTDKGISLRFGPGLIRKRLSLADIQSWRTVKAGWTAGWGIRWIGGWLYNVSGLQAVELMLGGGRRTWIGTDQPQALEEAIRYAKSRVG